MLMEDFNAWWSEISLLLKIYWIIAVPFTILFLLQLISSFTTGEDTLDSDAVQLKISFRFFTWRNIIGFFTIFAWGGIACIDSGIREGVSFIVALVSGLMMMTIMSVLFYFISKMNVD